MTAERRRQSPNVITVGDVLHTDEAIAGRRYPFGPATRDTRLGFIRIGTFPHERQYGGMVRVTAVHPKLKVEPAYA